MPPRKEVQGVSRQSKRKDREKKQERKKYKINLRGWLKTPADWERFNAWAKINAQPRKIPEPESIVKLAKPLSQMKKRIQVLSEPMKKIDPSTVCRLDSSVSKAALRAKPSKRIKKLAKFSLREVVPCRELPIRISRAVLRYKPTDRIIEISKPLIRIPEECRALEVSQEALNHKTTEKERKLALAKKAVECPDFMTDKERNLLMTTIGVRRSAFTYKITPWVSFLALPSYRFLMDRNDETAEKWKKRFLEESEARGKKALEVQIQKEERQRQEEERKREEEERKREEEERKRVEEEMKREEEGGKRKEEERKREEVESKGKEEKRKREEEEEGKGGEEEREKEGEEEEEREGEEERQLREGQTEFGPGEVDGEKNEGGENAQSQEGQSEPGVLKVAAEGGVEGDNTREKMAKGRKKRVKRGKNEIREISEADKERMIKRKAERNAWRFIPGPCKVAGVKKSALTGKVPPRVNELCKSRIWVDKICRANPFGVKKSALSATATPTIEKLAKPKQPRESVERPPPREKDEFGRPVFPEPVYGKILPKIEYKEAECRKAKEGEREEVKVEDEQMQDNFIDPIAFESSIDPLIDPHGAKKQARERKKIAESRAESA